MPSQIAELRFEGGRRARDSWVPRVVQACHQAPDSVDVEKLVRAAEEGDIIGVELEDGYLDHDPADWRMEILLAVVAAGLVVDSSYCHAF